MSDIGSILRHAFVGFACVALITLGAPGLGGHQPTAFAADPCPPQKPYQGWARERTVQYNIYLGNGFDASRKAIFETGFSYWTLHNTFNCSLVRFEAGGGQTFVVSGSNGPKSSTETSAVATSYVTVAGNMTVAQATIVWWGAYTLVDGVRRKSWEPTEGHFASAVLKDALHEIGHGMALSDAFGNSGGTVMNQFHGQNDKDGYCPTNVTLCDNLVVSNEPQYRDHCLQFTVPTTTYCIAVDGEDGCPSGTTPSTTINTSKTQDQSHVCCYPSPLIVDVDGDGFAMTDEEKGVNFDIGGDGALDRVSWTRASEDDAWLVLDRNVNDVIDNGQELFGTFTFQGIVAGQEPNGFRALALLDDSKYGGDGNGKIDTNDLAYQYLRFWVDANHNGISETSELTTLASRHVLSLWVTYQDWRHTDPNGNYFKYQSVAVFNINGAAVSRVVGDVYLLTNGGPDGGYGKLRWRTGSQGRPPAEISERSETPGRRDSSRSR